MTLEPGTRLRLLRDARGAKSGVVVMVDRITLKGFWAYQTVEEWEYCYWFPADVVERGWAEVVA